MNAPFPVRRLSDLARSIDYGVTASASDDDSGTKFLRITDIQDGAVDWDAVPFCEAPPAKLRSARLSDGDIVFARTGATTGKSFLIRSPPDEAVFASYLIRVRPSASVDPAYLAHFFQSRGYWSQIQRKTQGAAQGGVNATSLSEVEVPLPPMDEQRRIATILDTADALRRKRKRALELLDTLTPSLFLDMFGDPVGSDVEAALLPLDNVVCDIESGWSPTCLDRAAFDDEPGVLKLSAVTAGEFSGADNKALPADLAPKPGTEVAAGDILFCRKNTKDLVGSSVYVWQTRSRLHMSDLIFRLVVKRDGIEPIFLQAQIALPSQRRKISDMAGGAAGSMPNISKARLRELKIFVPDLSAQKKFAKAVREQRAAHRSILEASLGTDVLFTSLQHRAFSGQL